MAHVQAQQRYANVVEAALQLDLTSLAAAVRAWMCPCPCLHGCLHAVKLLAAWLKVVSTLGGRKWEFPGWVVKPLCPAPESTQHPHGLSGDPSRLHLTRQVCSSVHFAVLQCTAVSLLSVWVMGVATRDGFPMRGWGMRAICLASSPLHMHLWR